MKIRLAVCLYLVSLLFIQGVLPCFDSLIEHVVSLNELKSLSEEQFLTMLKAEKQKASQEMINLILFAAVEKGYLSAVRKLIEHRGANVNALDSEGYSPLDRAIFRGALSIIVLLHKHGAQLGIKHRATEAVMAVLRRDVRRVHVMLLNCNDELRKQMATYLLNLAICCGYRDIAVVLVDAGANVSENFGGMTPLHCAVLNGNTMFVDYLLKTGADNNAPDINGNTPLHMAAWIGNLIIVRSLVERGARVNSLNRLHATPYACAHIQGHKTICEYLTNTRHEEYLSGALQKRN